MKTRKVLQWFMLIVCVFTMGNRQAMAIGDKKDETKPVDIPLITGKKANGNNHREIVSIPFIAYCQEGSIYISTSAEFSSINVSVVNETTGPMWYSTTDISDGMGEINISNGEAGHYSVEIVTEYGECFIGEFNL